MKTRLRWIWVLMATFFTSALVILLSRSSSPLVSEYGRIGQPGPIAKAKVRLPQPASPSPSPQQERDPPPSPSPNPKPRPKPLPPSPSFRSAQASKIDDDDDGHETDGEVRSELSRVELVASLGRSGRMNKMRFRFSNVRLSSDDTLTVYLDPGTPLPPAHAHNPLNPGLWKPKLPTAFIYTNKIKFENHTVRVEYKHATPKCERWEERPVYLIQIPFPDNVWHQFNDGMMGAFSTLREEGVLPMAEIDDEGNMREYREDFGVGNTCPFVFDLGKKLPRQPKKCAQRGVTAARCDTKKDLWCTKEGLVVTDREDGPILVRAKGVPPFGKKLRHLYRAISTDIRPWGQMVGTCFRSFYVGKSTTLDFYNIFYEDEMHAEMAAAVEKRDRRLAAFRRLVVHAEQSHRRSEVELNGEAPWKGYADEELEALRRGIGPQRIEALEALRQKRQEGITEAVKGGAMAEGDADKLRKALRRSHRNLERILEELDEESGGSRDAMDSKEHWAGQQRPVLTFMWRKELSRCIVNEADLLEYILRRYNVTVRITTFEEPMLETMQLMAETDVLLGNHGAGWVNTVFLKEKGAAMQMFPYGWAPKGTAKKMIRGGAYYAIIRAKGAAYRAFVNFRRRNAFLRAFDFRQEQKHGNNVEFSLHPKDEWEWPSNYNPGNHWVYQNTVIELDDWVPVMDSLMKAEGIPSLL